jgi:hypothetical protein
MRSNVGRHPANDTGIPNERGAQHKAAHRDGAGLEGGAPEASEWPDRPRIQLDTRGRVLTRERWGRGAEGMSGTSRTAQDEERGRPAPGESRAQPRDNGEREWRCQDALIVAGKRLVPEALQGAEIVAVGQPLELGPLVSD